MPRGAFDLIVVSELLYYLRPQAMQLLLARIAAATAPGGRVVLLHHLRHFADASQLPSLTHRQAKRCFEKLFLPPRWRNYGAYETLSFDRRV